MDIAVQRTCTSLNTRTCGSVVWTSAIGGHESENWDDLHEGMDGMKSPTRYGLEKQLHATEPHNLGFLPNNPQLSPTRIDCKSPSGFTLPPTGSQAAA